MLYRILQFIGRPLLRLYFQVRVEGKENIPTEGACIVVANHTSFLDPILLCGVIPRIIHYITYAFFYYHPYIHWICKRVFCIPVKKDGKDISALKKALRLLRDGELVGIFPEGVRSVTGKLGEAEPGVALMALKANVPILPVGIRGAYEAFPKGARFPKPHRITITFGKPFLIEDYMDIPARKNTALQQEAITLIMSKIAEVCSLQGMLTQEGNVVVE